MLHGAAAAAGPDAPAGPEGLTYPTRRPLSLWERVRVRVFPFTHPEHPS
jgi:hypothetical protein